MADFACGDILLVDLDTQDPALRLRERLFTGVGVVCFPSYGATFVYLKWISAPREFYYKHQDADVFVDLSRVHKKIGHTDIEVQP